VGIGVNLRSDLIDQILPIPDEVILTAFIAFMKSVRVTTLIRDLQESSKRYIFTGDIRAEVSLDIDADSEFFRKFVSDAGDFLNDCLSLALEEVIRAITSDSPVGVVSPHWSRAEFEDDEGDTVAHEDLTTCCLVEAFNDGLGNLLCPECGGFILNTAIGRSGCPACGSGEIGEGGICQLCCAYVGRTRIHWDPEGSESWHEAPL
jgi:hypothetical protein